MPNLIDQGYSLSELGRVNLEPGKTYEVRLQMDHVLSETELMTVREELASRGVDAIVSQNPPGVMRIKVAYPQTSGIAAWPLLVVLPLIALGGVMGWKILSFDPVNFLVKAVVPLGFITGGLFAIAYVVKKVWK